MRPLALTVDAPRLAAALAAAAARLRSFALELAAIRRRGRPTLYIFERTIEAAGLGPAIAAAARDTNTYNATSWRGAAPGMAQVRGVCGEPIAPGRYRILATIVTGKPNAIEGRRADGSTVTIRPFAETDFSRLALGRLIHFHAVD